MSHTTIYFLTKADTIEGAINGTEKYLDGESYFYESYEVLRYQSGWLSDIANDKKWLTDRPDSTKIAECYLAEADANRLNGKLETAGYCYRHAALLYDKALTYDMPIYNIDSYDYEIPWEVEGWFAIAVYLYL
jgi:hypothetical protein